MENYKVFEIESQDEKCIRRQINNNFRKLFDFSYIYLF